MVKDFKNKYIMMMNVLKRNYDLKKIYLYSKIKDIFYSKVSHP